MAKRFICVILILLNFASVFAYTAWADNSASFTELNNCKSVCAFSGKSNAYFYGFGNSTLYSARAVPSANLRYVSTSGRIRAVCHDENCAYALFDGSKSYGIVRMNMNSGSCDYCTITDIKGANNQSFAVSGNEIFILQNSNSFSYVKSYNFSGKTLCSYNLPGGTEMLFCNGSKAYARTYSGEIYRLSGGNKTKCADLEAYTGFTDAGCGHILADDGRMISLDNGDIDYPRCDYAVMTNKNMFKLSGSTLSFSGGEYNADSAKLMCAAGQTAAVLDNGFRSTLINANQINNNNYPQSSQKSVSAQKSSTLKISDGIVVGIEAEITVTKAKERFPEIVKLYDFNEKEITAGKLKTGYYALIGSKKYPIAIRGDVNGTGTLNRADIIDLMDAIIDKKQLTPCQRKAADFNFNGKSNSQDLVFINMRIMGEI